MSGAIETPSPGRIALVANKTRWFEVCPDGVQVICTLDAYAVAAPPTTYADGRPCLFGLATENDAFEVTLTKALALNTRLVAIDDGQRGPFSPEMLRQLKPWMLPMPELYCYRDETIAQAVARWHTQADDLERRWPYDIAAVLQAYTMNGTWSPDGAQTIAAAGVTFINQRGSQWKLPLCFAWDRLDGGQISVLAATQQTICAQTPGWPTFQQIPPIPPPPVRTRSIVPLC